LAWPELVDRIADHAAAHAAAMELAGNIVVIPGGEAIKNQHDCVEAVLKDLCVRHIDRQSYAIAIGGGAVLDAVGFAAAIFHRADSALRAAPYAPDRLRRRSLRDRFGAPSRLRSLVCPQA